MRFGVSHVGFLDIFGVLSTTPFATPYKGVGGKGGVGGKIFRNKKSPEFIKEQFKRTIVLIEQTVWTQNDLISLITFGLITLIRGSGRP